MPKNQKFCLKVVLLLLCFNTKRIVGIILNGKCPEPQFFHTEDPCSQIGIGYDQHLLRILYHIPADNATFNFYHNPCTELEYLRIRLSCSKHYDSTVYYVIQIHLQCNSVLYTEISGCIYISQLLKYDTIPFDVHFFNNSCPNHWFDLNIGYTPGGPILLWGCRQVTSDSHELGAWIIVEEDNFGQFYKKNLAYLTSFSQRLMVQHNNFDIGSYPKTDDINSTCWNKCSHTYQLYTPKFFSKEINSDLGAGTLVMYYVMVGIAIVIIVAVIFVLILPRKSNTIHPVRTSK